MKRIAAGAAAATLARPAFAVPATIKIGLVAPQTGPLAIFYEEMSYALDHAKKALSNGIKINGTLHPLEFVVKDSQSSPNRASEVAQDLILKEQVHLVTTFATPETVNPVADQCELNGVPCLSNDDPLESFFFGRHGDPKKGFDWTYNYFFSGRGFLGALMGAWTRVPSNKVLGVLWANDDDGRTFAKVMPPAMAENGFKVIDPGRFDLPANNFAPEIAAFKAAGAELAFAVIPGPDFTVFLNQAAQQGFRPKMLGAGKLDAFGGGSGVSLPIAVLRVFGSARGTRIAMIYWLGFALALVALVATYVLLRSRIGIGLTAMRDNEESAASVGVNVTRARVLCFLGSAPFLGVTGALITLQKLRIAPHSSFSIADWTVFVIFNVVIGGIGTIEGPILGTIVFFVLRAYLTDFGSWYLMLLGGLSIVIILVDRRGLWGLIRRFLLPADLIPTAHRSKPKQS